MRETGADRCGWLLALPVLAGAGVLAAGCTVAQTPFPNLTDAEKHLAAALEVSRRAITIARHSRVYPHSRNESWRRVVAGRCGPQPYGSA